MTSRRFFLREPSCPLWLLIFPNLAQTPEIHSSLVLETNVIVARVSFEDLPQQAQHRLMLPMPRSRRVRGRQQPSLEPVVVELLPHREDTSLVRSRIEELVYGLARALVPNFPIIGAVLEQQFLIGPQKRSRVDQALIPQKHQPSAGLQDTGKLPPC